MDLTVLEIDEAIIRVAKDQFGFQDSDRLKVEHADGLEFIENLAKDPGLNLSMNLEIIFIKLVDFA